MTPLRFSTLVFLAGLAGCTATQSPGGPTGGDHEISFEEFVSQKNDTAYVGNKAAELEITTSARVQIAVAGKTADELATLAAAVQANPEAPEHDEIVRAMGEQLKFARNALKASRLNLNLAGSEPQITSATAIEGGIELAYEVRVESLIKLQDLMQGQTLEDFVGLEIAADLPMRLDDLRTRATGCWEDLDNNMPPPDGELDDTNTFFYWKPSRQGCSLGAADLSRATLRVTSSSADAPTVYPEYDQLLADNTITMTAIFGQLTHGDLLDGDSGFYFQRNFVSTWTDQGFERVGTIGEDLGDRLRKTFTNDEGETLTIEIDAYNPRGFADHVGREESNRLFKSAIQGREIVFYGGHSFYGSLSVLNDADSYSNGYQVFFMDSCWSYEYYTKQVFQNKRTSDDATGYVNADVVNNTEEGRSDRPSLRLWDTFMKGAVAQFEGRDVSNYSWNTMIEYMNETAQYSGELFGVSGVRNNAFQPGQTEEAPPEGGDESSVPVDGDTDGDGYQDDFDGDGYPD